MIRFTDELHVTVLNAVVYHLHKVTGAFRTNLANVIVLIIIIIIIIIIINNSNSSSSSSSKNYNNYNYY